VNITFLGSAASEGIPFPYCKCTTCEHARKFKGKNVRKRCSYLINDNLLIDIGPDLFTACEQHNVELTKVTSILVTHSHLDHFNVQNLTVREQHFHKNTEIPKVNFVAGPSAMTLLSQSGVSDNVMNLLRVPILPFETIKVPNYHIKSIKATHLPEIGDAMNYIISDGKNKILLASDTGIYHEEVWKHLANEMIDVVIIEATKGLFPSNDNHLNVKDINNVIEKLYQIKAIKKTANIYATHFGHQHCPPHSELNKILNEYNMHCVYDGLIVNVNK